MFRRLTTARFLQITVFIFLVGAVCLLLVVRNHAASDPSYVVLSYSENPTHCDGCPKFQVNFSEGGRVEFNGQEGCGVTGAQQYRIPEGEFRELVRAFHEGGFFDIPRLEVKHIVVDGTVVRLSYRDERRVHETVDADRGLPRLAQLEKRMRAAARLEKFLKPSVSTYQELLKSGWSVNTLGEDHENALTAAVLSNDLDSVRFLLQHGATVSERALHYSTFARDAAVAELLLNATQTDMRSPLAGRLLLDAAGRSSEVTRLLLQKGASANVRDPRSGRTPLMAAISGGLSDSAMLLLSKGAAVNARDSVGRGPLWFAANQTDSGFITLLVHHGANVNATDSNGSTALMRASDFCFYWDIEPLLTAGADPKIIDRKGYTAAHLTASATDPKCQTSRQLIELTLRK